MYSTLIRYLPRSVGMRRIALHKSISSRGDKMYLLVCECSELLTDISAAAVLIPTIRARLCGYTGLYRPIQAFWEHAQRFYFLFFLFFFVNSSLKHSPFRTLRKQFLRYQRKLQKKDCSTCIAGMRKKNCHKANFLNAFIQYGNCAFFVYEKCESCHKLW